MPGVPEELGLLLRRKKKKRQRYRDREERERGRGKRDALQFKDSHLSL